ncbi:MAG: hypothetical protein KDK60_00015 [Chlamydiia bacterium]|nr:hypothetical protein [Chlamydiia bacterium]
MTFFPEPLRPSEGRQEDKLRVDPIEGDKKKETPGWQKPFEEKRPSIYGAFLVVLKKVINLFAREEEGGLEEITDDALTNDLRELKNLLEILMMGDHSDDPSFCKQLTDVWHRILETMRTLTHTKRPPLINTDQLSSLMTDIDHYPPNEDHRLGYYLSHYAGEEWLPLPFREILKGLYSDHRVSERLSVLSNWVELLNEMLGTH